MLLISGSVFGPLLWSFSFQFEDVSFSPVPIEVVWDWACKQVEPRCRSIPVLPSSGEMCMQCWSTVQDDAISKFLYWVKWKAYSVPYPQIFITYLRSSSTGSKWPLMSYQKRWVLKNMLSIRVTESPKWKVIKSNIANIKM